MAAPVLLPGFIALQDILDQRVTDDLIPQINTAFEQSIAVHNQMTDQMLNLFVRRTTDFKIRYTSPVAASLQPLDEAGRARPMKMAGFYDVAFPLFKAGIAWGMTREARIKATVRELNDRLALMFSADKKWLRMQILSRLFVNTNYTFGDPEFGNLTVLPLANGDSQVYLVRDGSDLGESSVQHFRAQTAAIGDETVTAGVENPFPVIEEALTRRVENDGEVVVLAASNLETSIRGLTNFIEVADPDITQGITQDRLTGSLGTSVPGEVIGKSDRCWISIWDSLPSNYMIGLSTGGDRPLAMREHPEAELRGFQSVADRVDHPYFERHYERHAGFGAWNRVGALIYQVSGGDTTYDIPTGYTQPQI
jgi:hypothetical protein